MAKRRPRKKKTPSGAASYLTVHLDKKQTLSLTAEGQLTFWNALNEEPNLTPAQRRLGEIMRYGR